MLTVPATFAPLSGAVICTAPGVGVAEGLAAIVGVGVARTAVGVALALLLGVAVGVPVALAVGDALELMNSPSTFWVICSATGLTIEVVGPHGLISLKPHDHCTVPVEKTVAPLAA